MPVENPEVFLEEVAQKLGSEERGGFNHAKMEMWVREEVGKIKALGRVSVRVQLGNRNQVLEQKEFNIKNC